MEKKHFNSVSSDHDLYQGLCIDGLLVMTNHITKDNKRLYIIGMGISYDTIDYHDFNSFTLLTLSEFQITNAFRDIFSESLLRRRISAQTNTDNLLLEILDINKSSDVIYRSHNILRAFNPKQLPIFSFEKIKEILLIPDIISKYEHIDINLGVNF